MFVPVNIDSDDTFYRRALRTWRWVKYWPLICRFGAANSKWISGVRWISLKCSRLHSSGLTQGGQTQIKKRAEEAGDVPNFQLTYTLNFFFFFYHFAGGGRLERNGHSLCMWAGLGWSRHGLVTVVWIGLEKVSRMKVDLEGTTSKLRTMYCCLLLRSRMNKL